MSIGEKIKTKRIEKGLSLEKVGEHLGVKAQTIHKYENNKITSIPSDKIELLSELFDTSPAYFMGWETKKESVTLSDPDEISLITNYRELSKDSQGYIKIRTSELLSQEQQAATLAKGAS